MVRAHYLIIIGSVSDATCQIISSVAYSSTCGWELIISASQWSTTSHRADVNPLLPDEKRVEKPTSVHLWLWTLLNLKGYYDNHIVGAQRAALIRSHITVNEV